MYVAATVGPYTTIAVSVSFHGDLPNSFLLTLASVFNGIHIKVLGVIHFK